VKEAANEEEQKRQKLKEEVEGKGSKSRAGERGTRAEEKR
jgi:hypothetical protein